MKSNDLEVITIKMTDEQMAEFQRLLEETPLSKNHPAMVLLDRPSRWVDEEQKAGFTAVDMTTAAAEGFRDGRASVVVELPELRGDFDADDIAGVGLVIPMFDRGYDEAIEECKAAIIAAGGTVRE